MSERADPARCKRGGFFIPHEVAARHLGDGVTLLRAWREYLGMTHADLAERLIISPRQVAQWEAPGARPSRAVLQAFAAAMGLHIDQLTEMSPIEHFCAVLETELRADWMRLKRLFGRKP